MQYFYHGCTEGCHKVNVINIALKKLILKRIFVLPVQGAFANRLQCHTDCKTQNGHQGPAKWPTGSGKGSNPRFMAVLNIFR